MTHSYLLLFPVMMFMMLLVRLAVAAWLTRPGSKRDPDKFLGVFNGLKGFDAVARTIEAWVKRGVP